jgi:hypothetical protein
MQRLAAPRYHYARNDPYDRDARIELVLPPLIPSREYMQSILAFEVPAGGLAIWFMGQNGFILKAGIGLLIGIDLYLTDICAGLFAHLPFPVPACSPTPDLH